MEYLEKVGENKYNTNFSVNFFNIYLVITKTITITFTKIR